MMFPLLSILVISHNQRELLRRCMNSLLAQKIRVPHEIVISDDRSSDGTWQLVQEYAATYTQMQQNGDYWTPQVVGCQCNSDECDPKNVSERCGWNKLNVYNHARGKYFVNIDADDFLRSDDVYQAQLDMLEAHPECSMCMQDVWQVNDGAELSSGMRWPSFTPIESGTILSEKDIISQYRALNQCYMIRRYPEVDCAALYGKHFDDTIITQHHLQFGPCVYLDRADYVWVQYKTSITKTLQGDDNLVEYGLLFLHHIRFIPAFASEFMYEGKGKFIHMLKTLSEKNYRWQLTERTQASFRETPGRIYCVFSHSQSTFLDRLYLRYVRVVALIYSRYKLKRWKYLYGLLIYRKSASKIDWKR